MFPFAAHVFSDATLKVLRDNRSAVSPLRSLLRWEISSISPFVQRTGTGTEMLRKNKTVKESRKVKNDCVMRVQISSEPLRCVKHYHSSYPTSTTVIAVPCRPYHKCVPRTESWPLILLILPQGSLPRDTKQFHHV